MNTEHGPCFSRGQIKTYSYTDCTSFVVMRRLGLHTAIALDADFQREGFALLPTP